MCKMDNAPISPEQFARKSNALLADLDDAIDRFSRLTAEERLKARKKMDLHLMVRVGTGVVGNVNEKDFQVWLAVSGNPISL